MRQQRTASFAIACPQLVLSAIGRILRVRVHLPRYGRSRQSETYCLKSLWSEDALLPFSPPINPSTKPTRAATIAPPPEPIPMTTAKFQTGSSCKSLRDRRMNDPAASCGVSRGPRMTFPQHNPALRFKGNKFYTASCGELTRSD